MDMSNSPHRKFFHANKIPCVSQTREWKGIFENHFMNGKEICEKYPILDPRWQYESGSSETINHIRYDGHYYTYFNDFHKVDDPYSDPWYRELKHDDPIFEDSLMRKYHTTIESNGILLVFYKTSLEDLTYTNYTYFNDSDKYPLSGSLDFF